MKMNFWLIDFFDGMGFVWKWIFYVEGLFIFLVKILKKIIFGNDLSGVIVCYNVLFKVDILIMIFYWDLEKI